MSQHSYNESIAIDKRMHSFEGLIMAAMRQADSFNAVKLGATFPEIYKELKERYNAPGGILESDED